jgi:DNA-binding transcriptional MocR family regulator
VSVSKLDHLDERAQERYEELRAIGLKLDLTRGKPSPAQLALSSDLLSLPGAEDYLAADGTDCRNYGGNQGLLEVRTLFAGILGAPAKQVIVGNNASLALMHDTLTFALLKGMSNSVAPWGAQGELAFLCPVPGYDRHFAICEEYGIRMIPVALTADGPDMDQVEKLVAEDASIKGIWCVPKYSNPTGAVYSDEVARRLASMKTAAPDFRIYWDNAYCIHHLTEQKVEVANILELCAKHNHPDRAFVFASTSKITLAGAGLSFFASSEKNVAWLLDRMKTRTIGPDKINQLRHMRFLKDAQGIASLMEQHRALIAPKFKTVLDVFDKELSDVPGVTWTKPLGGYFISLEVPKKCARRVVALAKQAGIALTPAGATHPYGLDVEDQTIRIAPTFPDIAEVAKAAEAVAICVKLAVSETRHAV